jgi:hypothetical protein
MSEEQATNEAAPAAIEGQAAESASTVEQVVTDSTSNEQNVAPQVKVPTDKPVSTTPAFDAKTSYDALQKSYSELRREFTRRTQHESELQKKLDNLASTLAKATETPLDPQQFLKDLQTQPDKALEPLFMKHIEGVKSEYAQKMEEMANRLSLSEFRAERLARLTDGENYPDFKKLEPLMKQLAEDENTPLDFNREPGEIIDALYKLARTLSMEQAINEAKTMGKKEAETQLAKEAATSVVTGGKSGVPTSPNEIKDLSKLRQYFVNQIGEAE